MRTKIKNKNNILTLCATIFVVVIAVLLSACNLNPQNNAELFQNTIYSHLVMVEGGKTSEQFRLNYSAVVWETEQDKTDFLENTQAYFEDFSTMLNTHYKTMLEAKDISSLQQTFATITHDNSNFVIVASFPNSDVWEGVSIKDGLLTSSKTVPSFFTYTVSRTVEKIGSVIKVGGVDKFVGDYFFEELNSYLNTEGYSNVVSSSEIKNVFAYATNTKKLKSDAEAKTVSAGKYFHFWNFTNKAETKITFSSTSPRVEIWYAVAIASGLLAVSVMLFVSFLTSDRKKVLTAGFEPMSKTNAKKFETEEEKSQTKEKKQGLKNIYDKVFAEEEKAKETAKTAAKETSKESTIKKSVEVKVKETVREKAVSNKAEKPNAKSTDSKEKSSKSKTTKNQQDEPKTRKKTTKKED